MSRTVATIDIGTNTLLLLIVRRSEAGDVEILEDQARFGRLGKGLDSSGNLSAESIDKSLTIAREYRDLLDRHAVTEVRAVGTQALREAANAAEFVGPAQELLGARIETIPGEREAELVYRSVREQFPELAAGDLVIADVGGGSTEIIVARNGQLSWFRSIKIGSVRMTERHLKSDPPTQTEVAAAAADIDRQLVDLDLPRGGTLVATAGTATTIAALDLELAAFSRERVHGHAMAPEQVEGLVASLLEASVEQRLHMAGMEAPRADVIAGGALVFSRLVAAIGAERFLVADCGVRWGLAYEILD